MRDPAIDTLRGISIVLVVAMHYCYFFFGGPRFGLTAEEFGVFYRNGAYGVTLFFVISGFLITQTSLQRFGTLRTISARRFYLLRAGRIYPPLLLLLATLLVLHFARVPFGTVESPHRLGNILGHVVTNRANWYLIQHGSIGLPWDVLWSLAVEEMFYLFFPLVALLVPGKLLPWLLAGLIGFAPYYRVKHVLFDYLSCVDQLAIGCLVAWLVAAGYTARISRGWKIAAGVVGAAMIVVTYFGPPMDNTNRPWGPTWVAVEAALLIVATRARSTSSPASPASRPAVTAWTAAGWPLRALGRSSYEIYLFHGVVMVLFIRALPALQPVLAKGPGGPDLTLAVLYTGAIAALGYLLRRFYSEPFNTWVRRRWDHPKPTVPSQG